jgi:arginyl-tRNA synthetase
VDEKKAAQDLAEAKLVEAQNYLAAMRCAANYAWANRQVLTHHTREAFEQVLGGEVRNRDLLVESQGAWVVPLEADHMPPALILKKDEATLYLTRDIAAAEYRFQKWNFAKLIYIVGGPQKLHFQQLFKVLELMGYPWSTAWFMWISAMSW